MKLKLNMLTEQEAQMISQRASLTPEQSRLFALLLRDDVNDIGAMQILHIGLSQYYALKGGMTLKILHVLFEDALNA